MVLKNIMFDNIHSFDDLGLILSEYPKIDLPEIRKEEIEIPGRSGTLDLTETLTGFPVFENRKIEFNFHYVGENHSGKQAELSRLLHGNKMKIVIDDDNTNYYLGRLSVDCNVESRSYMSVTITADCDPYKYSMLSSVDRYEWDTFNLVSGMARDYFKILVDGSKEIEVLGERMPVSPVIISNAEMFLEFNGKQYIIHKGRNQMSFVLYGDSKLKFTGSGIVSIEYRGGDL